MIGSGLLHAWVLDGCGGGRALSAMDVATWQAGDGVLWVHLDYTDPSAQHWLHAASGLPGFVVDALLAEDTRPRVQAVGDGLVIALRGVNLSPGADPEDMVAVRVWADATRIVTTRRRRLMSAEQIDAALAAGAGPESPGAFVVRLAELLVAHMRETIDGVEERVADIEEAVVDGAGKRLRGSLSAFRRQTINLRRYLAPQRDAMLQLFGERVSWLNDADRLAARQVADHLMRYLEDLESVRDRAAVVHEELSHRVAEQMNRRMYVLSLMTVFFLPLTFLTGLLGINVGGIPGATDPEAFVVVLAVLAGVFLLQVALFRRQRWL